MNALLAVAGFVFVAAITPGPNNLVVMRMAMCTGVSRALPAIAGVVAGGMVLLGLATAGLGRLAAADARIRSGVMMVGCCYLAWLGASLIVRSFRTPAAGLSSKASPAGAAGLFAFQFLNPKGWAMVMTAASTIGSGRGGVDFASLAVIFIVIPAICLLLWSSLGALLARHLARNAVRRRFDRGMGALLVGSALLLLIEG
ncbi:MAG TPA: LysE family translocator [Gammaproteobacteria bacterium]|nr:LysE family translocator [Gammaproteobacteria bacterium]